ncbi:hypothetical protein [Dietzia sp. MNB45]|uniref:hypothetical protein n=1 Tax=Dietzia sp. MNB45 TaxID=3238800 RepID=UPI003F7FC0D5
MNNVSTLEAIEKSPVYQEIMRDSFGGVIYNVANAGKYQTEEIENIWNSTSPAERECAGGVMKGAFHFLEDYRR